MALKTTEDYYESVNEKFPLLAKSDIKKIINYGWK